MKHNVIKHIILAAFSFICIFLLSRLYFNTFAEYTSTTNLSEITPTTVIVDDLDADWYYYKGLNYTKSDDGSLPDGSNQDLYNENNMVKVIVSYDGTDLLTNDVGYVSNSESQYRYVYHKYYPVTENGDNDYVLIELIDNPFADRPNNKGFNGWATSYRGATISFDESYYERYAKIPVTYTGLIPDSITINFNALWIDATTTTITRNRSSSWSTALTALKNPGMQLIDENDYHIYNSSFDVSGYYTSRIIYRDESIDGYYANDGTLLEGICENYYCEVFVLLENTTFNSNEVYYELDGTMTEVDNDTLPYDNKNVVGNYKRVNLTYNQNFTNLYDSTGVFYESGRCSNGSGCAYYELQQYYNGNEENKFDPNNDYYYLVTRDTNIVVVAVNLSYTWSNTTKPFTVTSLNNDTVYYNTYYWNISSRVVNCYSDVRIEFIKMRTNVSNSNDYPAATSANTYLVGRYNNVKVGRGVIRYNNYKTFAYVLGGSQGSTGSTTNVTKYKLIVESGYMNSASITNGIVSTNVSVYIKNKTVFGNDYDRIDENNTALDVYHSFNGGWGGNTYSDSQTSGIATDTIVKSGSYGVNQTDYATGIYVGAKGYTNSGYYYAARKIKIEGGDIFNINGGPFTAPGRTNVNDTYIYMTGGEVDVIIGGAGQSATYGNRIIQVTGGTVNNNIYGGSNGYLGDTTDGTLYGTPFIYVGGNSTIGLSTLNANDALYGAEIGSVFGIGNGRKNANGNDYTSVGSCDNSNIIINDNAYILNNVYGGGNYGAVGIESSSNTTYSKINIMGGTINGSVYGGGNNNGAGNNTTDANINISMTSGTINGSIYGGSNQTGTIFGNVNLNITGGRVNGSVYGGGEGGTNDTNEGTFVSGNVDITIGTSSNGPIIIDGVYGGSAYGTVNGTTANNTPTQNTTTTTIINSGTIGTKTTIDDVTTYYGGVYGGGKGNANYTPYVKGDIVVNITGGDITNVYGGNDVSGVPSKTSRVSISGGTIDNAYGGGNQTSLPVTNISISGGSVTKLFGGSNVNGNVTTSNVNTTGGNVTNVYGGNNLGGTTATSNVTINGGTFHNVYGGGSLASTNTTNVTLESGTVSAASYGGGESAYVTNKSNITLDGMITGTVFGGSNVEGTVSESNVQLNTGKVDNVYGGNNKDGSTTTARVFLEGAETKKVYGGGLEANTTTSYITISEGTNKEIFGGGRLADVTTTNVILNGGTAEDIYGGSDENGEVTTSNITSTSSTTANNLYGGNKSGGTTTTTNINISTGNITNIFGGGYKAETITAQSLITGGTIDNVYGGGYQANVETSNVTIRNATIESNVYGGGYQASISYGTDVKIISSIINGNVYGGGQLGTVGTNTNVYISSSTVRESAYAGGHGTSATVFNNTNITIDGTSNIVENVFGGGNAAATGIQATNDSIGTVNIVGGTIGRNVYGGANTARLYGKTNINIGYTVVNDQSLTKSNIEINGTVFGGGEANAEGNPDYDYTFISVTKDIEIRIDASTHTSFEINGSIFGSGNASSTAGDSYVYIRNFGTFNNYKTLVSIQRVTYLSIDNSAIEFTGDTDSTSNHADVLFSMILIEELKIKNGTSLFFKKGTYLVYKFKSMVDIDNNEEVAEVNINNDSTVITSNVDNRIYAHYQQPDINITTNEENTSYGQVVGMTFFGLFTYDRNGKIETALYDKSHNNGDAINSSEAYYFDGGSHVLGQRITNHNTKVDGFYSNYATGDNTTTVTQQYIVPTPTGEGYNYYIWAIGEEVTTYEITLKANKYNTLGTKEFAFLYYSNPNTVFTVVGFNYDNLDPSVSFVDSSQIPRVASTSTIADTTFGLKIKNGTNGWTANGETSFYSDSDTPIQGTRDYQSENSSVPRSLMFYLYHSKNISSNADLGYVIISLKVITPISDIANSVQIINIKVNLKREMFSTVDYEATISPGKKLELFASSAVHITEDSTFSAYYALYTESPTTIYGQGYHHSLVSTYVLPLNTKITMIDLTGENPEYYYHIINSNDVTAATAEYGLYGESSYDLSKFTLMGSTSSSTNYNEALKNQTYYNSSERYAMEEFIFVVDFSETEITTNVTGRLSFELRNADDRTIINVLSDQITSMMYNLYAETEASLVTTASLSKDAIYGGDTNILTVNTTFDQAILNTNTIIDTNYYDKQLGLKISFYDDNGHLLNGSNLLGLSLIYGGNTYYASTDGSIRIKTAGKVANVLSKITIKSIENMLASGVYTIRIESFASADGQYFGLSSLECGTQTSSHCTTKTINIVDILYGLKITTNEANQVIDNKTGLNINNTNAAYYLATYSSGLENPRILMTLERRDYQTVNSQEYNTVDLQEYVSNTLYTSEIPLSYIFSNRPSPQISITLRYLPNLKTGTYRLKFKLYDDTEFVGEDFTYFVIK